VQGFSPFSLSSDLLLIVDLTIATSYGLLDLVTRFSYAFSRHVAIGGKARETSTPETTTDDVRYRPPGGCFPDDGVFCPE